MIYFISISLVGHLLKLWTQRTSRCVKRMWGPLFRRCWGLWLSLESPQGIRSSLHLVRWNMSLHLSHCRETPPSLSQDISGSIPLEAENTESLSHIYFWGKAPLEVLVKSCLTSSVEDGNILIPRWYGVHGTFLKLLYWNWWSSILETVVSGSL